MRECKESSCNFHTSEGCARALHVCLLEMIRVSCRERCGPANRNGRYGTFLRQRALTCFDVMKLPRIDPDQGLRRRQFVRANVLAELVAGSLDVVCFEAPRHREALGILDGETDMQMLSVRVELVSFRKMQSLGVRQTGGIQQCAILETGGLDDKCVSLPARDRISEIVGIHVHRKTLVEISPPRQAVKGQPPMRLYYFDRIRTLHQSWHAMR